MNIEDMTEEKMKEEWERLNSYWDHGCPGAIARRLRIMDRIAEKIGYPMTYDLYLEDAQTHG